MPLASEDKSELRSLFRDLQAEQRKTTAAVLEVARLLRQKGQGS